MPKDYLLYAPRDPWWRRLKEFFFPKMVLLPTLSDGKRRRVSAKRAAEVQRRADAAGKSLREYLEFGGN